MDVSVLNKVSFDHTYTIDNNHLFLKKLGTLGFKISKNTIHHPGSVCKFIYFSDKKYIEFVDPITKKNNFNKPGISFRYKGKLKNLENELKVKGVDCKYLHRNYDWQNSSKQMLPGWNFLLFKNLGFNAFFPWFTEYEKDESRTSIFDEKYFHPNGVNSVLGHHFVLNEKGFEFFSLIFKRKMKDKFETVDGISFFFTKGNFNKYRSLILKTSCIRKTRKYFVNESITKFFNYDGYSLKNVSDNSKMWDVIIVS